MLVEYLFGAFVSDTSARIDVNELLAGIATVLAANGTEPQKHFVFNVYDYTRQGMCVRGMRNSCSQSVHLLGLY
jgi:hypothetical protein